MHKLTDGAKAVVAAFPETLRDFEVRLAILPPGSVQCLGDRLAVDAERWVRGTLKPPLGLDNVIASRTRSVALLEGVAIAATIAGSQSALDDAQSAIRVAGRALLPLAGDPRITRVVGSGDAMTGIVGDRRLWPHFLIAGLVASDDKLSTTIRRAIVETIEVMHLRDRSAAASAVLVRIEDLRRTVEAMLRAIAKEADPKRDYERIADDLLGRLNRREDLGEHSVRRLRKEYGNAHANTIKAAIKSKPTLLLRLGHLIDQKGRDREEAGSREARLRESSLMR